MRKYLCLFVLAIFTFVTLGNAFGQYIFGPQEYMVYATLIEDWYDQDAGQLIVIRDRTALHRSAVSLNNELIYVRADMPELTQDTINDFIAKNLKSYPLGRFIELEPNYMVISQAEINDLFEFKDGWKRFYKQYPDANGIFTFSRVGFNYTKTQALVYVANQWDHSTGAGVYIFLKKRSDGTWDVGKELRIWNSWILEEMEPIIPIAPPR